ncbi:MAG TPA: acyl-CoA dehydrogenase family protein [Acidimicrobiales bacterium]|nr:acyl-CoA dehydrogenase family protein [Acidimicrobiales bacterium]
MNFGFDDDQQSLRDAAEHVLAAESGPAVVRAGIDDPDAWRPLWATIVGLGWPALAVPEDDGGLGLGVVDLVALAEVTGRHVLPAPFLSSAGLAVPLLATVDTPAAHAVLAAIAGGTVTTVALAGPDPRDGDLAAGATWDGATLSGTKRLVTDGTRAETLVVTATSPDGPVVAVVPATRDGVRVEPVESVDPNRPLADVHLDRVALDPAAVAQVDPGAGVDAARTVAAAELVGVCDKVLEIAVEHVSSRTQFGRPLGAFQAVKHRLADVFVATERARTLTYNAAMLLDDAGSSSRERSGAAAMAKAAASEAAIFAAKSAVQVHGAIAMTWEHDLHLYTRRARQGALCLGDRRSLYRQAGQAYLQGVA